MPWPASLPEEVFARLVRLAGRIFQVPKAGLAWREGGQYRLRAYLGPVADETDAARVNRELAALLGPSLDAHWPVPTDAFAGAPLRSTQGNYPAALYLLDPGPREFSADDVATLTDLAAALGEALALHATALAAPAVRPESSLAACREGDWEPLSDGHADELRDLRAKNSRLMAVVDHAVTGMIVCDAHQPGWPIIFTNSAFSAITGYAPDECLGRNCAFLQGPDTDPVCVAAIRAAIAAHRPFRGLIRNYRKDGTPFWNDLTINPVFGAAGELVNYVGVQMDVTMRIEVVETLRRSQENYRQLFDTNPLPCWAYDVLTCAFLEVNQAAVAHYGYAREEFLTMTLFELFAPEDVADLRVALAAQRADPEMESTWRNRKKDGTQIEVECASADITFVGCAARLVIVHDVTERNQAEGHRRAKEEAERANVAKNEFLSRMSHELRTPLNSILGFSQLLELGVLTESQQECVQHIDSGGRHLLKLIDEVLDIARVESGRIEVSLDAVALDELVYETVSLISPLASARGIEIVTRLGDARLAASGERGRYVTADRQRLKQVLLNLLSNAVKYNCEGGRVTIDRAVAEAGQVRLRITDTGPGIPSDLRTRLFMPFDRLGAEQTSVQGTGLGLALSKRLMEIMGGSLGLEDNASARAGTPSSPKAGAAFWLELPLAAEPLGAGEGGPILDVVGIKPLPAGRTLLYIEDNLANLTLVERLLQTDPTVRLISAMQGTLGLDLAREHRPDLILLDTHLPDLPGKEVLDSLQSDPRTHDIPVIVVSADAMEHQAERMVQAGACAYVTKPLNVKKFLETVREALLKHDAAKAAEAAAT